MTVAVAPVLHGGSAGAQVLDSLKQRTQRQRPQQQPPAQPPATGEQPGAPQRTYNLSRAEQAAVTPALQAAERSDWAATRRRCRPRPPPRAAPTPNMSSARSASASASG